MSLYQYFSVFLLFCNSDISCPWNIFSQNMKQQFKPSQNNPAATTKVNILEQIDNLNKKYTIGKQEYILLIKKQKDKDYCTLYVSNCESKFWIKKLTIEFMQELKDKLEIKTQLTTFGEHFTKNLIENSSLKQNKDNLQVEIKLKIGECLVMNCNFGIEHMIKLEESANDYKMIMKIFLKQLFEAKDAQIQGQKLKFEKYKVEEQNKNKGDEKGDSSYLKDFMLGNLKKNDIKPKNRSLLNPNQRKRKAGGIQFAGLNEI